MLGFGLVSFGGSGCGEVRNGVGDSALTVSTVTGGGGREGSWEPLLVLGKCVAMGADAVDLVTCGRDEAVVATAIAGGGGVGLGVDAGGPPLGTVARG